MFPLFFSFYCFFGHSIRCLAILLFYFIFMIITFGNCPSPVHFTHCKAQGESYDKPKYMELSMCLLATEGSYAYYSLRVRGILSLQINVNNFLEFPCKKNRPSTHWRSQFRVKRSLHIIIRNKISAIFLGFSSSMFCHPLVGPLNPRKCPSKLLWGLRLPIERGIMVVSSLKW